MEFSSLTRVIWSIPYVSVVHLPKHLSSFLILVFFSDLHLAILMNSPWVSHGNSTWLPLSLPPILGHRCRSFDLYMICFIFALLLWISFIIALLTPLTLWVGYHWLVDRVKNSSPPIPFSTKISKEFFLRLLSSLRVRISSLMKPVDPNFLYIGERPPPGSNSGLVRPQALRS